MIVETGHYALVLALALALLQFASFRFAGARLSDARADARGARRRRSCNSSSSRSPMAR